jgi:hypothetical protein
LNLLSYLSTAGLFVHFNQEMELATSIQILSYGILAAAGVAVGLDFLKARQELSRAMMSWRIGREEARR